ncbi:MAG: YicC family protein [Ekhidna sp.]
MQQSMTGFGRHETTSQQFLITTEVKTLNSKFLDFSPRIPKELSTKETEIRNLVSDTLKRGKVMLTIEVEIADAKAISVNVNDDLFKAYYQKFKSLSEEVGHSESDLIKLALQAPEVINPQSVTMEDLPWEDIRSSLKHALQQCIEFRKEEGAALVKKLNDYIGNIESGLDTIATADKGRADNIRSRLQKSLDEIKDKVKLDENRFEQELIFYLERLDISEEKVRLRQHLEYFREVITNEESAGKKLGFISQEIGREINTIGSKANDADIQRTVVAMKDDLEKIKEQILNII